MVQFGIVQSERLAWNFAERRKSCADCFQRHRTAKDNMLKEMSYVYAVYKERGFSRAAQSLHVTQPVVSIMVKRAETEFHAQIFDRSTSPVSLTSAGKIYIRAVERILAIQDETLSLFRASAVDQNLQIRIGASSLFCTYILPPVIKDFKKILDSVEVYWKEAHNVELIELLQSGSLDFVLEADDFDSTIFDSIPWSKELLILAVPASDPINEDLRRYRLTSQDIRSGRHLTPHRLGVPLKKFAQKPFVFLKDGNDTALRGMMLCRRAGFQPQITMKVDQLMTAYNLAREGIGSTIIPDNIPKFDDGADKLFFYTIDSPLTHRMVKLYSCRTQSHTHTCNIFWKYVQNNAPFS